MNIDEIQTLWNEDSKLDEDNLHSESTKIPSLHAKYHHILNKLILLKKMEETKLKISKKEKWQYYTGKADPEIYIDKPFDYKVLRQDIDKYIQDTSGRSPYNEYSDASLLIYNSNFNVIAKVNFRDTFRVGLSAINFDATQEDVKYVTAEATFKYSIYDIEVTT